MPTKIFLPTGGLNFDDDPSTLPDGDYIDAVNISKDVGVNGQGNTFRKIEGFTEMDSDYVLPFTIGENSAGGVKVVDITPDHENRAIYYLVREDTYAFIAKYDIDTDTKSIALPRYAHGGYDADTGNLRIIGEMLFWNYLSYNGHSGVPCSWYLPRTFADTDILTADVLLMAKPAPGTPTGGMEGYPLYISAITIDSGEVNDFLSDNDFQFAYRYVYDSGEKSVLSEPYVLYKGRENVESITLSIDETGNDYVEKYELYARKGNDGVWYRIQTITGTSFIWTGEVNETLSDEESVTYSHFIPQETKTIEVAFNRVFLGNNLMDLDSTVVNIFIEVEYAEDNYQLPDGTEARSMLRANSSGSLLVDPPSNTDLNLRDVTTWIMPFSQGFFGIGLALFNAAMQTPGVILPTIMRINKFENNFPSIKITNNNLATIIPDWAEYAALCITNNLNYDRIYEGYASNVFFEFDNNGNIYYDDRVTDNNIAFVKHIIIDISSMINEGHIYSFQEGDKIDLVSTTDSLSPKTFNVSGADGAFVYAEFKGDPMDGMINGMDNLDFFFNIYSPTQNTENVIYYPVHLFPAFSLESDGSSENIVPFGLDRSTIGNRLIGDCVFKTISYRPYARNPLITKNKITTTKTFFGKEDATLYDDIVTDFPVDLTFDTIYQNDNGGEITGSNNYVVSRDIAGGTILKAQVRIKFTYDISGLSNRVRYAFQFTNALGVAFDGNLFEYFQQMPAGSTEVEKEFAFEHTSGSVITNIRLNLAITTDSAVTGDDVEISDLLITVVDPNYKESEKTIDSNIPVGEAMPVLIRSMNFNDNLSWARNQSMPLLEVPAEMPTRKYNEIRHGGPYIEDTLINGISNFTALLRGNTPYENGAITVLERAVKSQSQGSVLLAYTKQETHSVYLGERQIRDTGDSNQLALTSDIIGSINVLDRSYGTSHPTSVVRRLSNLYFWDSLEKKVVRYNRNGLTVISEEVDPRRDPNTKMKKYFRGKTTTPHAVYDPFNEMYIIWFEGDSRSVAYSERENRWVTFLDYKPLAGTHIDDYLYSLSLVIEQQPGPDLATVILSRGQDPSNYGIFPVDVVFDTLDPEPPHYVEQDSTITFVFANPIPVNLENLTLRHASDVIDWARANNIKDNLLQVVITNENGQQTTVYEEMLMLERNMLYSHIARDENSPGGLIDGDFMEGYNNKIVLTLDNTNSDEQLAIAALSIGYLESSGHKL